MTTNYHLQIKRNSRRRNVALYILDAQTVEVRAPQWVADDYIEDLLAKRGTWIQQQLARQAPRQGFQPGESILFNGELHQLEWVSRGRSQVLSHKILVPAQDETAAERKVVSLLRQMAVQQLEDRADYWVAHSGLTPNSIVVRSFRSRWGSCDSRGDVKLNWRLIQAPLAVQDYVIIHELCHLQEMNHSPHFWRSVAQFDPHYKKHRRWLKDHANRLMAVG